MKKDKLFGLTVALAVFALVGSALLGDSYPLTTRRAGQGLGWIITASDDDVDGTAELLTGLDTTYAQLSAAATVYIQSGGPNTNTVYVSGVDSNDKYITEALTASGATAVTSTNTFKYVDQLWMLSEVAVATALYGTGSNTLTNEIPANSLKADVAQHFTGDKFGYVQSWQISSNTVESTSAELRWYPDDADSLDATDGYFLIDRIYVGENTYTADPHVFSDHPDGGIRLGKGGWLAVYATGGGANQEVTATVVGFNRSR